MYKQILAAAAVLTLALGAHSAPVSAAEDHDMKIKNATGAKLKAIYYRGAGTSEEWLVMDGPDGNAVWEVGELSPIKLDAKYDTTCNFDLKVVPFAGEEQVIGPVELCNKNGEGVVRTLDITKSGSGIDSQYE